VIVDAKPRSRRWLRLVAVAVPVSVVSAMGVGAVWAQRAPTAGRVVSTAAPAQKPSSPSPTAMTTAAVPTAQIASPASTRATTQVPSTTKTPQPKALPATKPASPPAGSDFGPRPRGSVTVAYQPGQHLWSAVSNGINMTIEMAPATPNAGEPVTFTETATAPAGLLCCALQLFPMDASTMSWQPIAPNGAACVNVTLPATLHHVVTHTFNKAGRIAFFFQAASLCDNPETIGDFYSSVDVGPGPSTAQGPILPLLHVDDGRVPSQLHDPTLAVAFAQASDADGHIAGFTLNWGDGTTVQSYPGDPNPCIMDASGWPGFSWVLLGGVPPGPPTHRYVTPKPTMITITTVSTGCDGTDPQQVSASFPWIPPNP
jgi:hypothetical protein